VISLLVSYAVVRISLRTLRELEGRFPTLHRDPEAAPMIDPNDWLANHAALIQEVAECVARQFYGQVAIDVAEAGLAHIWERRDRFDPSRGDFRAWCHVVLRNWACDLASGRHERRLDDAAAPSEADPALLGRMVADRRAVTSRLQWPCPRPSGVCYQAVFLLHLRLAVAARLAKGRLTEETFVAPEEVIGMVEWLAPWTASEELLNCRVGWPTLAELWQSLHAPLSRPPYFMTALEFCDWASARWGGVLLATSDRWYQWVKRAKERARGQLDEASWALLFSVCFPDHAAWASSEVQR
jgi:Sigma-70 region 2